MRNRAEKKIQIAIDKLIDLQSDLCVDPNGSIEKALEVLRDLEWRIIRGKVKQGELHI